MILFIALICIIKEFVENNQGTDDVGHTPNILKVAENNVILETTLKPIRTLLFETPDPSQQSLD